MAFRSAVATTLTLTAAVASGMAAMVAYPVLLPVLQTEWGLTNTEAGWIGGVFFAGYATVVPFTANLTDRMDPRRIVLAGMILSALAILGFSFFASGFWSATLWWGLLGAGFAGIYMPGLKALSDVVPDHVQSRSVSTYTTTFPLGVALSFFVCGELTTTFAWREGMKLLALGPALGFLLAVLALPSRPVTDKPTVRRILYKRILSNRKLLAYMWAYAIHNVETATMRTWLVALLTFSLSLQLPEARAGALAPPTVVVFANLFGLTGMLIANEFSARLPRHMVICAIMVLSPLAGLAVGLSLSSLFWQVTVLVLVYSFFASADTGSVNAGLIGATDAEYRGAAISLHAMAGCAGAFVGPVLFGFILDLAGGESMVSAWVWAFAVFAVLLMAGPVVLWRVNRA